MYISSRFCNSQTDFNAGLVLTYLPISGKLRVVNNPDITPVNKKQERVDELDVIGGVFVTLLRNTINRIKQRFQPRKQE